MSDKKRTKNQVSDHAAKMSHVCGICLKQFAKERSLLKHYLVHTGEKPHICNICEKRFARKGDLKAHCRIHTDDRPHACSLCEMKFFRKSDLQKHCKTHTKPHECEVCHKSFSQKGLLLKHKLLHREKSFSCNICLKGFDDQVNFQRHLLSHSGDKLHICDICGKCFLQNSAMLRHCLLQHSAAEVQKVNHLNQEQLSPVVDVVSSSVVSEANQCSRPDNVKPHVCDTCGKCFNKKNVLLRHYLLQHSAAELKKTNLLNQAQLSEVGDVASSSGLSGANQCSKPTKVKSLICDTCGKCFNKKNALLRHYLLQHSAAELQKTNLLNQAHLSHEVVSSSELSGATQEVNPPNQCSKPATVKSHICDICNKSFSAKSSRDRHRLLTHLSEQLRTCV